jgi:hypothetical protein
MALVELSLPFKVVVTAASSFSIASFGKVGPREHINPIECSKSCS